MHFFTIKSPMDGTQQQPLEKDLINLDKRIPSLKNNERLLIAIKEFLNNPNIPLFYIINEHSAIRKATFEIIRKLVNFPINNYDANNISNITDLIRKNIYIAIKTSRDVYEGEVTAIKTIKDTENKPLWIDLSLKTTKATKQVTLSKNLVNIISNINLGDIVYIEPNIGIVKRLGRSETKADEYDLEGDRYVQLSKGNVHSIKEREIILSLYDFDYSFNMYNDDITIFTRNHVDEIINSYIQMGIGRFIDSSIFIDSAQLLKRSDLSVLVRYNCYSNFKVVISGFNFENNLYEFIKNYFFISVANSNENVFELVEYFVKERINDELKKIISELVTFDNFELILNILKLTVDPQEFLIFYNLKFSKL